MKIDIIPFTGFNQIKFGQSLDQIKLLLGEPTETTREKHEDGTEDVSLLYSEHGVELSFMSEDDFRLGLITCYGPDYSINGISYIGVSEEDFLENSPFADLMLDEEFTDSVSKDYTAESKGLSFWVQDGFVESITLFPRYSEDGEDVLWP